MNRFLRKHFFTFFLSLMIILMNLQFGSLSVSAEEEDIQKISLSGLDLSENTYINFGYGTYTEPSNRWKDLTYTSSDESIIKISNHCMIALKPGKATVTASYVNSDGSTVSDSAVMNVDSIYPWHLMNLDTVSPTSIDIEIDYLYTIIYATSEDTRHNFSVDENDNWTNPSIYSVSWSSSNENVVKIRPCPFTGVEDSFFIHPEGYNGRIYLTPVSEGTATISASYGGVTNSVTVNIISNKSSDTTPSKTPDNNEIETAKAGDKLVDPNTGSTYILKSDGSVGFSSPSNNGSNITIPSDVTINGVTYPVTSILPKAFNNNKRIKKVTVGKNVTVIDYAAFKNATNLSRLDLKSSNVTTIGKGAFFGCKKLKTININGNQLKKVFNGAFRNTKRKANVTIYAKDKNIYKKLVKELKKKGLKNATFKYKKMK
ncbi:leucine-rich repeat protein [Butyrivibrio sp. WCD2001]|uniref:leucine-rich repeat protein n=1 Tax=Butyrivibrio sp. WCD2001 TaxID=1280681 RepID=UPI0004272B96|nr:leucine-rich repeat domain-containing protein [Butyrivibrio sp. WCD2001]